MCGIAGFLGSGAQPPRGDRRELLRAMGDRIRHRGPDHGDVWVDDAADFGVVHRRLSIVDLSPTGHQPMASASRRWIVAFNGEIYNHAALRAELEAAGKAPAWRGRSDTEVLLAAVEAWGVESALRRCVGMFAIALWDRMRRRLHLARDRLGEKPLYVGWVGASLAFASELGALQAHPDWRGEVDRDALAAYFRLGFIPAPRSIWRGVCKLAPGCRLTVSPDDVRRRVLPPPAAYWSLVEVAERGVRDPFRGDDADALDTLERLVADAVRLQRVADVPLGAFLSGGIDSSTIVALMQAQSSAPVRSFTIGFDEAGYDEAAHAAAVARHLGTAHTELRVTPAEAMAVIPSLPSIYDEPFADASQIPTACVASLARRQVTVSLSGDAGDELFGGYTRYLRARRFADALLRVPVPLRRIAAQAVRACPPALVDAVAAVTRHGARAADGGRASAKIQRLAQVIAARDAPALYRHQLTHWHPADRLLRDGSEPASPLDGTAPAPAALGSFEQWMMTVDGLVYLPDDILVKVDRAAMAVALETRVPFLDHRVVEFAWSLPLRMKLRDGQGKWLLRLLLDRYVPRELVERPKMGFGVPLERWLRGPLRDWAESLLDPARLRSEGFVDARVVRRRWDDHLAGVARNEFLLWDVLMFEAWLAHVR